MPPTYRSAKIETEVYDYITKQSSYYGETFSDILKRLLRLDK